MNRIIYYIIYMIMFGSVARADSIDYTEKKVICQYDLTIPLTDGTIKFIAVPLVGDLKYTVRTDKGHVLLAVDFAKDLKRINQDHMYNPKFIDNVDEYKCRTIYDKQ